MHPDLDGRQWTVPFNRDPNDPLHPILDGTPSFRDLSGPGPFVREGYLITKVLGNRGYVRPIPEGECAITSLACGDDVVYGATSGRRAHIFACGTKPYCDWVYDMAVLPEDSAVRRALVWLPGRGLYAGTSAPGRSGYRGGKVLRAQQGAPGEVTQEWNYEMARMETVAVPVEGEGIACMIGDEVRGKLYGLSDKTGTLFSVEAETGELQTHGPVDDFHRFSPELIVGPDGMVFGAGAGGRLCRFDPESGAMNRTGLRLPSMAGRGQYSKVGAWLLDGTTGLIYAGDVADGLLSVIDVRAGTAQVLGKPTAQPNITSLARVRDGRIYGTAGLPGSIAHLFCCDPARGEMRDLGVCLTGTERRWYGMEFSCAVADEEGRVYIGECDRISHLFVYFPPLRQCGGPLPASRDEA